MATPEYKNQYIPRLFSGMRNDHDYPGVIGGWKFDPDTNSYVPTDVDPVDIQSTQEEIHK